MNKSDLINAIADSADLSKADAGRALEATIDAITTVSYTHLTLPTKA